MSSAWMNLPVYLPISRIKLPVASALRASVASSAYMVLSLCCCCDVVEIANGCIDGLQVVVDKQIGEHPDRALAAVLSVGLRAESVETVDDFGAQNDGEVAFGDQRLVHHLSDRLHADG